MKIPFYTNVTDFDKNYHTDLTNFLEKYSFAEKPTADDFNQYLFEKYSQFRFEINDIKFSFRENKSIVSVPVLLDLNTALSIFKTQFIKYVNILSKKPRFVQNFFNTVLSPNINKFNVFSNLTEEQYKNILEHFVKSSTSTEPYLYEFPFIDFIKNYSSIDETSGRLIYNLNGYREYYLGGQTVLNHIIKRYFPQKLKQIQPNKKLRTADVNYKFALLEIMGVIKWLETNIQTNNDDRAEILQEIMGGSTETLKDYLKGKIIHKDVRQKAVDFINSKRYPN